MVDVLTGNVRGMVLLTIGTAEEDGRDRDRGEWKVLKAVLNAVRIIEPMTIILGRR